jgi:hypothetical protein
MSVAGSLANIDEALKRYTQGVDEWRETMQSLKDAEEEVGNFLRDREILCVVLFFFFLFVFHNFFQSDPVDHVVQLEQERGRQHQRVAAPQPPAISVVFFAFLGYWWGIPIAIAFSCVILTPPCTRV